MSGKWQVASGKWSIPALAVALTMFLTACEDTPPTDYVPEPVFTGYLYVGEPITDVQITRSLATTDSFDIVQAEIDDAVIEIWSDRDTFRLRYEPGNGEMVGRYRATDTTKLVEPETTYRMRAELSDGTVLTAETRTPAQIEWLRRPPERVQYPIDTLDLPPSTDTLIWTPIDGVAEYLIEVQAIDTIGYGSYFEPPTSEENRRIYRFFEEDSPRYDDVVRWGFVQNTQVTVVWFAFKWFGLNRVTIYAPDPSLIEWFKQVRFGGNQLDPLLSNVDGGIGVFGSASRVSQEVFVLKNQP